MTYDNHNENNSGNGRPDDPHTHNMGSDLEITSTSRRAAGAGTWIDGTLHGYRFNALVFPDHATNRAWEIEDSRISKLWVQRLEDKLTVYNWDRGPDVPAADSRALAVVGFLCEGLADYVYGGASGTNSSDLNAERGAE